MPEPTAPIKVEPIDEVQEIVILEVPTLPTEPEPKGIVTTKRPTGIVRGQPLAEAHEMTTESNRFRDS